jgi:hypothetical protein
MQAAVGFFPSQRNAESAIAALRSAGVSTDRITFLTPGSVEKKSETAFPTAKQAGRETTDAIEELSGGSLLLAAAVPGVGVVTAAGLLGAAVLTAAGANVGGSSAQNPASGLVREEEVFVYEHALRNGRTVVIALAPDGDSAAELQQRLQSEGAHDIDTARHQWWDGVRNGEGDHYAASGKNFADDEKFYRMGFEAALHARTRCMEFDQVSAEMSSKLEDLQREYPGVNLEEPFTRGYQRGREYYQRLCDESRAA